VAVELNTPIDEGGKTLPAPFVNRMQVAVAGPNLRLAFAEGFGGTDYHYRSAVVVSLSDAKEFAELILAIISQQAPAVGTTAADV
jgi:hypothetical protein